MSKLKKLAAASTIAGMITVSAFTVHTVAEREVNILAVQKVEDTVNSSCFEIEWLSSNLDEKQTNGLNKSEVLEKIIDSKNIVELENYYSYKNTVAYTYKTTKKIWLNNKFHKSYTVCEKAANLGHEILGHKNGFVHDVKSTKRRPHSVPYMIGTIIKKCCEE